MRTVLDRYKDYRVIFWVLIFVTLMANPADCFLAGQKEKSLKRPKLENLIEETGGFSVSAGKVSGASEYEFEYCREDSFAGAERIRAAAEDLPVFVGGMEKGTTWYVRCRALNGDVTSKWSHAYSIAITGHLVDPDLPGPYGQRILSTTDEGISIYWKKPEEPDGYEIWRSYHKNYGFELVHVETDRAAAVWTDDSYDKEADKIYYRVCSYVKDGDGRRCSPFTDAARAQKRTELSLDRDSICMFSGESRKILAYYGWTNAHGCVWTSSDPEIVSVSPEGEIATLKKGKAQITCEIPDEGQKKTVSVTVDREDDPALGKISHRFTKDEDGIYRNPDSDNTGEAVIMMAGDLMALAPQQKACRMEDGTCDFSGCFEYVKPVLACSDLALANLETQITSEFSYSIEEPYVGEKPLSNVSSRYLEAVINGGFDAVGMANNHSCDTGRKGIVSTMETMDRYGMPHTGLFVSKEDPRFLLFDVNGILVGVTAYNYLYPGYNGLDADWDAEDVDTVLNYYDPEKAARDLAAMRGAGAQFAIVYMHWGAKNYFTVRSAQLKLSAELSEMGYDYIAGCHSHTVQPFDMIRTRSGKTVPCSYSMGDFNSHINQITGNRDTVLMCVKIREDADGKVTIIQNGYIPFYIYTSLDHKSYVTISLDPDWNGGREDLHRQEKIAGRIADEIGDKITPFKPEDDEKGC